MTPRQAHLKVRKALRLADKLRDAMIDARCALECQYGSHTDIAASARRTQDSVKLTLGLVSDVFVQSSDLLLKDVSK